MAKKKINSILQKSKFCFICGTDKDIEKHHIYFGPLRSISDKNGFVVCLCRDHHRGTKSPHQDRNTDLILKRMCQKKYEMDHTHEEFMQLIGRNYLD